MLRLGESPFPSPHVCAPAPYSSYMGATLQYKTFVDSDQKLLRLFAYGNAGGRHI